MTKNIAFTRRHEIMIEAPAGVILDYVSNPNSWPEWLSATHQINSPDRPLLVGDTFSEEWHTRHGEARLEWRVIARDHPTLWTGETRTDFTGPILVSYIIEEAGEGMCRYIREMKNPDRPKPPTEGAIRRMDEEAEIALANIKRNVEKIAKDQS